MTHMQKCGLRRISSQGTNLPYQAVCY